MAEGAAPGEVFAAVAREVAVVLRLPVALMCRYEPDGTAASMVLHPLDMAEKLLGVGALKPRKWQLMRGEALLKMGVANSLGEAQNISMSLLRFNSQDPEALVLRGRALYSQGENDKAVQHFRKGSFNVLSQGRMRPYT